VDNELLFTDPLTSNIVVEMEVAFNCVVDRLIELMLLADKGPLINA